MESTTYSMKYVNEKARKEINYLRQNLSPIQRSNLRIESFDPGSTFCDIYGQAFGNSDNEASRKMKTRAAGSMRVSLFLPTAKFAAVDRTPMESYCLNTTKEGREIVMKFIKRQIKILPSLQWRIGQQAV